MEVESPRAKPGELKLPQFENDQNTGTLPALISYVDKTVQQKD